MMIFLSSICAGYVILWHKIILLLMIDIAKKDILTVFYVRKTDRPSVLSVTKLVSGGHVVGGTHTVAFMEGRRGRGRVRTGGRGRAGGWATAAAAARPGSQNSHDDFSQWHLSWLCDTVA